MMTTPPPPQQSGMFNPTSTRGTILCCICGVAIEPNKANMCGRCLRSRVDITEGLPRQATVIHCPDCSSYLQPPRSWLAATRESHQLLSILLRRLDRPIKRNSATLTDAKFVFTEEHSKRLRVRIAIQKEVLNGVPVQQSHEIEFVVHDRLCDRCSRVQANPDQWEAAVQLRQHVQHRRTFLYLEQQLLKHGIAANAIRVAPANHGLDFFFSSKSHANSLVDFLKTVAPVSYRTDKQLQSHDLKSSVYNYRYTFSVTISPICREDLVCLPPKVGRKLGNLGPLVLCVKVTDSLMLLDPANLRVAYLNATQYFSEEFGALLTSRQLVEYFVHDIEYDTPEVVVGGSRYQLAYAQIARVSDFGNIFTVRTHIGHLLNPGDYALGYDLYGANSNDIEMDKYKGLVLPDAILVKKSYEEKRRASRVKPRKWKLRRLDMDMEEATTARGKTNADLMEGEYEQFLKDLEENPELRFNINLYKNDDDQRSEMTSTVDGDELPSVPLDELIDTLSLGGGDDDDDEADVESHDGDEGMEE